MNITLPTQQVRELPHVRNALYRQPWAIMDGYLEAMCEIFELNCAGTPPDFEARVTGTPSNPDDLPFQIAHGVAIIPVKGPIFPKANLMTRLSGATALSDIQANIRKAQTLSPAAVLLDFDSPGGAAMGLSEFCTWLDEQCQNSPFPIISLINPMAASAAYMIAAQTDMVYSTEGGMAGSIGVVARLDNRDRADRNAGNDPIVLRSHELKAIGQGPVTPNQQNEMQRMLMAHFSKFKEAVVRGRPAIDIEQVSTGQAWMGRPANSDVSSIDMGLVDEISTLEKLIQEYGNLD